MVVRVFLGSQADEQNALSAEASIKGSNEEILARADAPVQRAISDDQDAIRAAVKDLVERFDIEPSSDFSAK